MPEWLCPGLSRGEELVITFGGRVHQRAPPCSPVCCSPPGTMRKVDGLQTLAIKRHAVIIDPAA
jgi:hypothetical protein